MLYCKQTPSHSRFARRAALAAALLTAAVWQAPTQADEPGAIALRLLPPLPVQVGQVKDTRSIMALKKGPQANPFCHTEPPTISLVSGEHQTCALQATDEAVTLQPVCEAAEEACQVDEEVVELVRPQSTFRLTPLPAAAPLQPDSPLVSAEESIAQAAEPVTLSDLDDSATSVAAPEAAGKTANPRKSAPVEMSLDDLQEAEPLQVPAPQPQLVVETVPGKNPIQTNELAIEPALPKKQPRARHRSTPANALDDAPIVVSRGASFDPTAELVSRQGALIIDVPQELGSVIRNPQPIATAKPAPTAVTVPAPTAFTVPAPTAFTVPAPAVANAAPAVASAPAAATRNAATRPVAKPSSGTAAPSTAKPFPAVAETANQMQVGRAQMRAFQFAGKIRCYALEDESICQVLPAGSSELRIIGQQGGSTRLAVWMGTDEAAEPVVYHIHVDQHTQHDLRELSATAQKLTTMLQATFPHSRVRVSASSDQLTLHGVAIDDSQASKMLQLVRQACLVPVIDQLTTR